jgi:nitroreductase
MDLVECITSRKTTRAFKPDPVPRDILMKILDASRNCASTENSQPWEFAVFGGQVAEDMKKVYQERWDKEVPTNPDVPYDPSAWPESYTYRRTGCGGPNMLTVLGIEPDDMEARRKLWQKGIRFWDAPNGIVISTDRDLPDLTIVDVGGIMQTILLLAHDYGLGCCPSLMMVMYPDVLRQHLDISPSKLIVIGICIGYPDETDPINTLKVHRLPLDEMVSWHGV